MQKLSKFALVAVRSFLFVVSISLVCLSQSAVVMAHDSYKPTGFVNDFANVIDDQLQATIEADLSAFKSSTSNEIAVLTVNDLGSEDIATFSNDIFREWKLGTAAKNNGILVVVAVGDRKARIEVGYGLEGAVTDALAGRIVQNQMTPRFKESDYAGGIQAALTVLKQAAVGEYNEPPPARTSSISGGYANALILGFFVLSWISSFLARSKSIWAGGVIGAVFGGVGLVVLNSFVLKSIVFLGAIATGLILDLIVSRAYAQNINHGGNGSFRSTRGGFWGGGFGGGLSGGGGFGGFGGGSSGGGGASGSW